jgi:membrane peptidoglycan carboxypeptidase
VRTELQTLFSDRDVWQSGLHVYTNLDPIAQSLAQRELTLGIKRSPIGVSQGALVTICVKDGAVLAMSGGAGSFEASPWNRALSPHTAGSAFKPFVYLTGILSGALKPETSLYDSPLTINIPGDKQPYSPRDFDGLFMGPLSVRTALALSRNVCAVRVAQMVGVNSIIDTARKAGITSKLEPTLALALGASAVSPLELAGAYASLARQGTYIQPNFIRQVTDMNGKILFQAAPVPKQVFAQEPVAQLVELMKDVVSRGTGRAAALPGRDVAGKTGTADGARDVWFVGFTPDTVTAIWGGNDGDKPISGSTVTGGSVAATIWHSYMSKFYQTHQITAQGFPSPSHPFLNDEAVAAIRANQFQANPNITFTGEPQMPSVAPDFRTHKTEEHEKKGKGGLGHFLHKVFNLF